MVTGRKVKKQARKKTEAKDIQEYISCLQELHKLQGALLEGMDKRLLEKIF